MPSVKIRVESVSNDEIQAQKQGEEVNGKDKGEAGKIAVASIFAHQAISTAKQTINSYIGNLGDFTGNYVKQDNLQREIEAVGQLVGVGAAFATNWVAGVAMVAGLGIKAINDYRISQRQIELENKRIEYLRQRNGDVLDDGSRRR